MDGTNVVVGRNRHAGRPLQKCAQARDGMEILGLEGRLIADKWRQ